MQGNQPDNILNIRHIIDDAKCYETVRMLRWHDGVRCPFCDSVNVIKHGRDGHCQKYKCNDCPRFFEDLTRTIFSGHHQPLSVWILCLYFMGLNLSNRQIAHELDINESDVQKMAKQLRSGVVDRKPDVKLSGEAEFDEVYVVAGHKGKPAAIKKRAANLDATALKERVAVAPWKKKSLPSWV